MERKTKAKFVYWAVILFWVAATAWLCLFTSGCSMATADAIAYKMFSVPDGFVYNPMEKKWELDNRAGSCHNDPRQQGTTTHEGARR